jgi:hypothetical protein
VCRAVTCGHCILRYIIKTTIHGLIDSWIGLLYIVLCPAQEFFTYMETNLGLCSVLRGFEQGRILIVPHLLWYRASVFAVSSEGPSHSVASYDIYGYLRTYSDLDPHWVTIHGKIYITAWYIHSISTSTNISTWALGPQADNKSCIAMRCYTDLIALHLFYMYVCLTSFIFILHVCMSDIFFLLNLI